MQQTEDENRRAREQIEDAKKINAWANSEYDEKLGRSSEERNCCYWENEETRMQSAK